MARTSNEKALRAMPRTIETLRAQRDALLEVLESEAGTLGYMVSNPSAWDTDHGYDEAMSEILRRSTDRMRAAIAKVRL